MVMTSPDLWSCGVSSQVFVTDRRRVAVRRLLWCVNLGWLIILYPLAIEFSLIVALLELGGEETVGLNRKYSCQEITITVPLSNYP